MECVWASVSLVAWDGHKVQHGVQAEHAVDRNHNVDSGEVETTDDKPATKVLSLGIIDDEVQFHFVLHGELGLNSVRAESAD